MNTSSPVAKMRSGTTVPRGAPRHSRDSAPNRSSTSPIGISERHQVRQVEARALDGRPEHDVPDQRHAAGEDGAHVQHQPQPLGPGPAAGRERQQAADRDHVEAQVGGVGPGRIGPPVQHAPRRPAAARRPACTGTDATVSSRQARQVRRPRSWCRETSQAQLTSGPVRHQQRQVPDQGLMLVSAPAEDLPQPVAGHHDRGHDQDGRPDPLQGPAAGPHQPLVVPAQPGPAGPAAGRVGASGAA